MRNELSNAFVEANYEKASELQYKKIPEAEKELKALESDKNVDRILS